MLNGLLSRLHEKGKFEGFVVGKDAIHVVLVALGSTYQEAGKKLKPWLVTRWEMEGKWPFGLTLEWANPRLVSYS